MSKKALFIDRDGTILVEPMPSEQVDSLEKLEFLPGAIRNLYKIANELDFELVMVTNQDGMGTESFPMADFQLPHSKMLEILKNEGVVFDNVLIDDSFPYQKKETRKPGIGLLTSYIKGNYDLQNSFVLGDRHTDIQLAKNLGAKGIYLRNDQLQTDLQAHCSCQTTSWDKIYEFLRYGERNAAVKRTTHETDIDIQIDLSGRIPTKIQTGIAFFDHMLDQVARHGGVGMQVKVAGDLAVDEHHTIEDTALALGHAFKVALGDKRGIERYGFALPMDESTAQVLLDFGGRPHLVWDAEFKREKVGEMPTEMFKHFFKSFSDAAAANINIKAEGDNEHHKIEGIFKAFAKAIKMAIRRDPMSDALPSTKGTL